MPSLFAGLFSLAALALFLAWALKRSSALTTLLAAAAAMLFFTLAGCLGVLYAAGWAWYALCAAGLVVLLIRIKGRIVPLLSPGWLFFVAGGALFIVLFAVTRPLLTQWDEFTFWGTAGKVVSESHQLYTVADSGLIARSYPPGLIVFGYMMQFISGFTEHGLITAYAIFALACLAPASALWRKHKTIVILALAALFALPLLFTPGPPQGGVMGAYLYCMADAPMALLFGGALCFYFAGGGKTAGLVLGFGVVLAALVNVKDMGLALALIALLVAALDLLFCERDRMTFFKAKRWGAFFAALGVGLACILAAYLGWALHMYLAGGANRFNLGNAEGQLSMPQMLLAGFKALFGIQQSEQYLEVSHQMLRALFTRPVMLWGSGAVVLGGILVLLVAAWLLAPTRRRRRRVLVFTLAMCASFAAFYLFNVFTYSFIFTWYEGRALKDYARYITPFWMGWAMGALVLLADTATTEKAPFYRLRVGRLANAVFCLALLAAAALGFNWEDNFLRVSPSLYTVREDVRAVLNTATAEGMRPEDRVYVVSQRMADEGARFYVFNFELRHQVPTYAGEGRGAAGAVLGARGQGNTVSCTPGQLAEYLREQNVTHVLLDYPDTYFIETFAPLFSDGLAGWTDDDSFGRGSRYYRVRHNADGTCTLIAPLEEGDAL